jgi:hypothetical protein
MWSTPLDDGGTPITDFIIYWDEGLGSSMGVIQSSVGGPVT